MGQLLLGIDIGTYSSKGLLTDLAGKVLKSAVVDHDMEIPKPGWAEQDADKVWWGDLVKICKNLLDGSPFTREDVGGVAISAIGPCMLPLDSSGRPLRKGILYGVDTRASAEIDFLNEQLGETAIQNFCGMALSSQAVGPKILWMRNREPTLWEQVDHITTASSYLVYRLTGQKVMDRHTGSHYMPLMDIRTLEWSDRWADTIADLDVLPRLAWSDEIAGHVSKKGASETGLKVGTPVAVGAVDALSEAISVGVVAPGDLMIMYGSTAFFILVMDRSTPGGNMWNVAGAFRGQYNVAAGMATAGSLTRWFRDELAADLPVETAYETLFSQAQTINPGSDGLIVLPYFSGERTPINDPGARGMFAGLSLAHTRAHLFRATLEGISFGIRHNMAAFNETGAEIKRVVGVGGGTKSIIWPQIVSDMTGLDQIIPAETIGASYGDAFLAGLAAGLLRHEDLRNWVKPGTVLTPDSGRKSIYDRYYDVYLSLYLQTRDLIHNLV